MLALIALGRAQRAVHRSEAAESTHREALELIENSRIPFTLRPVLAGDLAADLARSDMNSTAE